MEGQKGPTSDSVSRFDGLSVQKVIEDIGG